MKRYDIGGYMFGDSIGESCTEALPKEVILRENRYNLSLYPLVPLHISTYLTIHSCKVS